MSQKRKRLSGPEKLAIVKRYLVDRVPISDLCDEHSLQPSQVYRWQAAIFEHGADVFDMKKGRHSKAAESVKDAKIARLEAIVADKGYHSTKVLVNAAALGMRTYIPERAEPKKRRWTDKDPNDRKAVYATRRRTKGAHGKLLSRARSELVERSFAHVCDTGGARRTWLRGLVSVTKRHMMVVAVRNLSTIMRVLFGIGCPKALQGLRALLQLAWTHFSRLISAFKAILLPTTVWDSSARGIQIGA